MNALRRLAVCAVVLLGAAAPSLARETPARGTIGGTADWAVPYYDRTADAAGPTVLIVGGMHGNEPAGDYAAEQIRRWPIRSGRLVVLPQANRHARAAFKRKTPGVAKELGDLNRNFPRAGQDESPRGERAHAIWALTRLLRPTWVVDLHEGFGFRKAGSKSVGSSVIYHPTPEAEAAAQQMVGAVNETIDDAEKAFVPLRGLVDGSLARAAGEHLGAHAMIVETTSKKQARSLRVRQQRIAVHTLLRRLGMLDPKAVHVDTVRDPTRSEGLAVALYDARGTGGKGVPLLWKQLRQADGIDPMRVGPDEIRAGVLQQHDVVVFSGGTGSGQATALTEAGRERVREFIRSGGGYLGICAGAYLALDGFSWGLGVLDGKTVSPKWRRGKATLKVRVTDEGRKLFGQDAEALLPILYHNGPVFRAANESLRQFKTLAVFEEEVAEGDAPKDVMVGTPAIASGTFGKGRVCVFSPHPEQTKGLERLVLDAVRWAGATEKKSVGGVQLTEREWKQLRDEARKLMVQPGEAPNKRALLARLLREDSARAWNLVAEFVRAEADHVAKFETLRIENWAQTARQFAAPLPHARAVSKELFRLFDETQGTRLHVERGLLAVFTAAIERAPDSVRERVRSDARRATNPLLRAAAERLRVRVALARSRAPAFRGDPDVRVRIEQVVACDGREDCTALLRAALGDKAWAVRVSAARVVRMREDLELVPELIEALGRAHPREAHALTETLRHLTGETFASDPAVWGIWWRDHEGEPAPFGPEAEETLRPDVTFYGLPVDSSRVCFLIDTSVSMGEPAKAPKDVDGGQEPASGRTKLDVAKAELKRAIQALWSGVTWVGPGGEVDVTARFNIVAFNTAVISWQPEPVAATEENKRKALAWIDAWKPGGNTCLFAGLRSAFRMAGMDPLEGADPVIDTIVVLSDGQPTLYTNGDAVYQQVAELRSWVDWYNIHRLVRVHAVSITTGKASTFMRELATEHGGHFVER